MNKVKLLVPALVLLLAGRAGAQQTPAGQRAPAQGGQRPAAGGAAANPPAPAPTPAQATRWLPQSWTSDHRHLAEGDLVTVLVDEYTLAAADRTTSASQKRSLDASLNGSFGSGAAKATALTGALGSGMDNASQVDGSAHHQDQMTAQITARVTKVEPGGLLRVEGRKVLRIDGHDQQIAVTGLIRSEDVSSDNLVDSSRLADARVEITSDKRLGEPKKGILSKIAGMLWP